LPRLTTGFTITSYVTIATGQQPCLPALLRRPRAAKALAETQASRKRGRHAFRVEDLYSDLSQILSIMIFLR